MVLGSFYFRLTTNGNLMGEFMNNLSQQMATESADVIGEQNDNFIGDYQSTWFDGNAQTMRLSITQKAHTFNIFRLVWSDDTATHFVGEAFLSNEMLIGVYGDGDLDKRINNLLTR